MQRITLEPNILAMNFAKKLERAMKSKGLDRNGLIEAVTARGLSLSDSTLSNYLNGRTRPSMDIALAMAKKLEIPLDYLADDSIGAMPVGESGLSEVEAILVRACREQKIDRYELAEWLFTKGKG